MNRVQVATILGIGLFCVAPVPLLLPYSRTAASTLPEPIVQSVIIALAGVIVIILAYIMKLKPVPAH
ncbi:MAG: hypothetical protein PVJ05_12255 [Candidatus Thorarchaeota archaeon]|jgi:hypothetical protein